MPSSQNRSITLLKKLLFKERLKQPLLQRLWSMTHTLSLFGMNYGGGGLIESSGETWVLENVIRPRLNAMALPVIFDVGANVGDYSFLVRQSLPQSRIYAFEPAAASFDTLSQRIAGLNGEGHLTAHHIGFSDVEDTVDLYSYTVEGEEVSLLSSVDRRLPTQAVNVAVQGYETIRVQTIDGFCRDEGIGAIAFLKIDVEGHEVSVLRGARGMLGNGTIGIIQFEFGPANIYSRTFFYDFWSLLSDNYDFYRIIPHGVVPITYYGEHREIFLTTNYLAIRR